MFQHQGSLFLCVHMYFNLDFNSITLTFATIYSSPGTGRTGTLIAVDICMRTFEDTRRADVLSCVHKLRSERAGSVQTKEQYNLIYQVRNP